MFSAHHHMAADGCSEKRLCARPPRAHDMADRFGGGIFLHDGGGASAAIVFFCPFAVIPNGSKFFGKGCDASV